MRYKGYARKYPEPQTRSHKCAESIAIVTNGDDLRQIVRGLPFARGRTVVQISLNMHLHPKGGSGALDISLVNCRFMEDITANPLRCSVVYNRSYGGFSLSKQTYCLLLEKKGFTQDVIKQETNTTRDSYELPHYIKRDDDDLVATVRELCGAGVVSVGGRAASIAIDDNQPRGFYTIREYDGAESIELDPDAIVDHLNVMLQSDTESSDEKLTQIRTFVDQIKMFQ